ncbi:MULTISPECIES: threonine/homoserine exporter RhtA [Chromohalobacter]|uniref:Threonine/homoserine exporter RhtA n=1 Tax=Chromohalobacter beijerinckii TaxID=86179 RepID=A0ABV8X8J5_9GAMM|nr:MULTISPECIES: threonine/homoserine exporter RhtA [Chromohalobacter]MCK0753339.1 threonine/homoserine exporter RhtA [Chromohalobacter japonicus]MCK0766445.1 threonine/homoserine exporter RhtA [Chromohalobacter beijerinckii]
MSVAMREFVARVWPVAMLIVAMCSIQTGASIAKTLFPVIGATGTTSIRLILAALILLVVMRPWRQRFSRRAWKSTVIYGVALGVMNLLFYQALQTVPLGIAVALEFTGPLTVAMLSSRRWLDLLWVAFAVLGLTCLLLLGDDSNGAVDPYGAACALGAGVCWALYILFGQKAGSVNGAQSATLGITIAAVVIAPVGLIDVGPAIFAPEVLPLALAVAVLSTALPYTLEMVALPRLPTQTFGTLMSLEPAIGALSGLLFLSQLLSGLQWMAIGLIIVASIGTTLTVRRRETFETPVPD